MKKIFLFLCVLSFSLSFGVDLPEYTELIYVKDFKNFKSEFQKNYFKKNNEIYADYLFDYLYSVNYPELENLAKAIDSTFFKVLKNVFYFIRTKEGNIFLIEFKDSAGSKLINDLLNIAKVKKRKGEYYISVADNFIVISKNEKLSYNFKKILKKPPEQLVEAFKHDPDIVYSKRGDIIFDKGVDELFIRKREKSSFFSKKEPNQITFLWNLKKKQLTLFLSPASKKVNEYIDKNMARGFPFDLIIFFHLPSNPYSFFSAISSENSMKSFEKDFKAGFYDQVAFGYRTKENVGNFIISMKIKENFYQKAEYFMKDFVENFSYKDKSKTWDVKKYNNYRIFQNRKNEVVFWINPPYIYLSSDIKLLAEVINTLEGKKKNILDSFAERDFKDFYINDIGTFLFNFESLGNEFFYSLKGYSISYSNDVAEYSKWLKSLGSINGRGILEKEFDKYEFVIK